MSVSYKKIWKLLINKGRKKKDLKDFANLSPTITIKLSNKENVSMDVLNKSLFSLSM